MYYLIVENLGVERCIHMSEEDVYMDGMSFSCVPDLGNPGIEFVKDIRIVCIEAPDPPMGAKVYRD